MYPSEARHAKISDVKNFANLVAGIRQSSRLGRFFGYFLPPRAKSIIARKRKGSRLYFALNKKHVILS